MESLDSRKPKYSWKIRENPGIRGETIIDLEKTGRKWSALTIHVIDDRARFPDGVSIDLVFAAPENRKKIEPLFWYELCEILLKILTERKVNKLYAHFQNKTFEFFFNRFGVTYDPTRGITLESGFFPQATIEKSSLEAARDALKKRLKLKV